MPAQKNGFTLIELLIVISIIAVLSAIGLVAYGNFLKNSRDSRRQSDLKLIQSALEEYYADQTFYPGSMSFSSTFSLTNATGNPASPAPSPVKAYLNSTPIGPTGSAEYRYQGFKFDTAGTSYLACDSDNSDNLSTSTRKCVKYCLYAKIEGSSIPSDGGCADFTGLPSGYNYGVNRP